MDPNANTLRTIPISELLLIHGVQPRVDNLDARHLEALAETPDSWPPLHVVQRPAGLILVDGFHRYHVAKALGLPDVRVEVLAVPEDEDLLALGFALNAQHGRALTLKDRRSFAAHLLRAQPILSDREVGRRAGVAPGTVARVRTDMNGSVQIGRAARLAGARLEPQPAFVRSPGELPTRGVLDAARRLLASSEKRQQRELASYFVRLSVALSDQHKLKGWESIEDAARACRVVLGEDRSRELAADLGLGASNALELARLLGYDPVTDAEFDEVG